MKPNFVAAVAGTVLGILGLIGSTHPSTVTPEQQREASERVRQQSQQQIRADAEQKRQFEEQELRNKTELLSQFPPPVYDRDPRTGICFNVDVSPTYWGFRVISRSHLF